MTRAIVGTTSNVQSNHIVWVFWENQFFVFLGAQKNFLEPPRPSLALETTLLVGHTYKTF